MKTLLTLLALVVITTNARAGSATWKSRPSTNDWNIAANWRPRTIPNGPNDTATFGVSDTTDVVVTAEETEVDRIVFSPGARSFTITANVGTLVMSGLGIENNSGVEQNFVSSHSSLASPYGLSFHNQATAGTQTFFTVSNDLGYMAFNDDASAGSGTFLMMGTPTFEDDTAILWFFQNSSAANGIFTNTGTAGETGQGGITFFLDNSTAANGTITNKADTAPGGYFGAQTNFSDNSTAADSIITNEGAAAFEEYGGYTVFADNATAGNAIITCNGAQNPGAGLGGLYFYGTSNASIATLIANGGSNGGDGGLIQLWDTSDGGRARVELFGNGTLDITNSTNPLPVSIGSLEGNGIVLLGLNELTVGTNNLSTEFSGLIQGGDTRTLGVGAVLKVGSGTLTLSRANTYSGGTFVSGGFLRVENRTGSATGSGPVQLYTPGTLGGGGIVGGSVIVNSGGALAPGSGATTLTVKRRLAFSGASYYIWRVRTISARADKVIAGSGVTDGVVIFTGAFFTGLAIGNTTLPPGTTFTAIDNASSGPISGTFANLPDGGTVAIGNNTFQANYEGGDGNDLTLTVVP